MFIKKRKMRKDGSEAPILYVFTLRHHGSHGSGGSNIIVHESEDVTSTPL